MKNGSLTLEESLVISCKTKHTFKKNNFTYLLAALGLCCCAGFSLVVESRGYSLIVVRELLIVVASLVVEHRL